MESQEFSFSSSSTGSFIVGVTVFGILGTVAAGVAVWALPSLFSGPLIPGVRTLGDSVLGVLGSIATPGFLLYCTYLGISKRYAASATYRLHASGIDVSDSDGKAEVLWPQISRIVLLSFGPFGPEIDIYSSSLRRPIILSMSGLGISSALSPDFAEFERARAFVVAHVHCPIRKRWV